MTHVSLDGEWQLVSLPEGQQDVAHWDDLAGSPPFPLDRYRTGLEAIAALAPPFKPEEVAR